MTTQMKALHEYFLMVVFMLLLNSVHVFSNFMFNMDKEKWQSKHWNEWNSWLICVNIEVLVVQGSQARCCCCCFCCWCNMTCLTIHVVLFIHNRIKCSPRKKSWTSMMSLLEVKPLNMEKHWQGTMNSRTLYQENLSKMSHFIPRELEK